MPAIFPLKEPYLPVTAKPLTSEAFAPFGEVIQNPKPDLRPHQHHASLTTASTGGDNAESVAKLPYNGVSANQGSAIKYQNVSHMVNTYDCAPSGVPGRAIMNMFACAARTLLPPASPPFSNPTTTESKPDGQTVRGLYPITILERHPHTTQAFIPLPTQPSSQREGEYLYLVIVAPSLVGECISGVDAPPDLGSLAAFVVRRDQAVSYGAGTWHAPMVALGEAGTMVEFVVVQFVNGVGKEDCEEVVFERIGKVEGGNEGSEGMELVVEVPR